MPHSCRLSYAISLQYESKPLTTSVSSACLQLYRVTTLWLKHPISFYTMHALGSEDIVEHADYSEASVCSYGSLQVPIVLRLKWNEISQTETEMVAYSSKLVCIAGMTMQMFFSQQWLTRYWLSVVCSYHYLLVWIYRCVIPIPMLHTHIIISILGYIVYVTIAVGFGVKRGLYSGFQQSW